MKWDALQLILVVRIYKSYYLLNREKQGGLLIVVFSEHRNESRFVYSFEETAPHQRLSKLWTTPLKGFKIKVPEFSQL